MQLEISLLSFYLAKQILSTCINIFPDKRDGSVYAGIIYTPAFVQYAGTNETISLFEVIGDGCISL